MERLIECTGLRPLCIISIECRYCNPLATSASFRVSGFGYRNKDRDRAYDSKAIHFGVFWYEVQDVSFNQPFSDDA